MIGIDIVAISRISRLKERRGEDFLKYFLNDDEINIAKTDATIAGFFAAKEAISKALGCGISAEFSFFDAQIYKDEKNAPKVKLSEKIIKNFNLKDAQITISHDGGFAIAAAILQKADLTFKFDSDLLNFNNHRRLCLFIQQTKTKFECF